LLAGGATDPGAPDNRAGRSENVVLVHVLLRGVFGVLDRMQLVAMGQVRVMARLLVVARFGVLGRFAMMLGRLFEVLGRFVVVVMNFVLLAHG
jgi:hypothetical protein